MLSHESRSPRKKLRVLREPDAPAFRQWSGGRFGRRAWRPRARARVERPGHLCEDAAVTAAIAIEANPSAPDPRPGRPTALTRFRADAIGLTALVTLNVALYHRIVQLFWTYDDANILRTIFDYRFVDFFVNSNVWPQQLFTPLMIVAFDAQLALFGLTPRSWYAMHLVIASATLVALYAAVRQFLATGPALAAVAIFTAGVPVCSVIVQLSTVHYLLSLLFCACAVTAYAIALRRSSRTAAALSIACYFLAMLSKEVAVPLPLLLVALPLRDSRSRVRYAAGHVVAAMAYFIWRYAVLGTFLGAYSWKIDLADWPGLLVRFPWRLAEGLAGKSLSLGLVLIALMAVVVLIGIRTRRALVIIVLVAIVTIGPILPLAKELNRRYVVVPWLGFSIAFVVAAARLERRRAVALIGVVALLAIVVNRQEWADVFAVRRQMSDEARFFLFELPPDGLLRSPATPPSVMGELRWLKTIHLSQPAGGWFYDDLYLCVNNLSGRRVWEYQKSRRGEVEITSTVAAIGSKHCGSIHSKEPLTASFRFLKPAFYWDLGPYTDGRYSALIGNGIQTFEIGRRDALNLPGTTSLVLRIRYDSPRGWTTYSPEIPMDFLHQDHWTWRRAG
jgi:hypothetical protein